MKFIFKAKDPRGDIREGKIDAVSKDAATALLQEKSLIPISIELEAQKSQVLKDLEHLWEGVSLRELSVFYRQLSTLIEAKVSIVAAIDAVSQQMENVYLRTIAGEMMDDIQDGMPFSESMAKHRDVFDSLAINIIKAGEVSGNLQRSMNFLAENTEKNYELNSKIKGALFYPGFVLSIALLVGFVVFAFVIPKLTGIFTEMNVEIPWYTKMMMGIGSFMSAYWWLVLFFMLGIVASLAYYFKTEEGRKDFDALKIKIPIIGNIFQYIYVARFSENLAVLLEGGIPIVKALVIVSEVVNNSLYEGVILRSADEVKTGGAMSNVFFRSKLFPPIVSQMIKIGEETGKISEVLGHIAVFYTRETDRITNNLSKILEPILIVFLGIGVAIIVFSVLVPIYNIAGSIG